MCRSECENQNSCALLCQIHHVCAMFDHDLVDAAVISLWLCCRVMTGCKCKACHGKFKTKSKCILLSIWFKKHQMSTAWNFASLYIDRYCPATLSLLMIFLQLTSCNCNLRIHKIHRLGADINAGKKYRVMYCHSHWTIHCQHLSWNSSYVWPFLTLLCDFFLFISTNKSLNLHLKFGFGYCCWWWSWKHSNRTLRKTDSPCWRSTL